MLVSHAQILCCTVHNDSKYADATLSANKRLISRMVPSALIKPLLVPPPLARQASSSSTRLAMPSVLQVRTTDGRCGKRGEAQRRAFPAQRALHGTVVPTATPPSGVAVRMNSCGPERHPSPPSLLRHPHFVCQRHTTAIPCWPGRPGRRARAEGRAACFCTPCRRVTATRPATLSEILNVASSSIPLRRCM
jgi:hypothetical protein